MSSHKLEAAGGLAIILMVIFLCFLDGLVIFVGWNHFVAKVTTMPEVSFFSAVAGGLLKTSLIKGFGLRIRKDEK